MRFVVVVLSAIFFSIIAALNCTDQDVQQNFEVGDPEVEKRTPIASGVSSFRQRIISSLTERLEPESVYIRGTDLKTLNTVNSQAWDAVIIIHSLSLGEENEPVIGYLQNLENRRNCLVIPIPAFNETKDWDAQSRASANAELDALVQTTLNRLDLLLELQHDSCAQPYN